MEKRGKKPVINTKNGMKEETKKEKHKDKRET